MANKNLFQSLIGKLIPEAASRNREGAPAYAYSPEHALAQYAMTGCLSTTFYADAGDQLKEVLSFCAMVSPEFIAKVAVHSRKEGAMKDMPVLLCAVLSAREPELVERIFDRVIDNARMVRNFVQIIRSGVVGRKSLGSVSKRLVRRWLAARSGVEVFRASVGNDPSLRDIIKMVHPKPSTAESEALYGYLLDRPHRVELLPTEVRAFEAFKADPSGEAPDVQFQMLSSLALGRRHWVSIAKRASWQTSRMNLNTFARHGAYIEDPYLTKVIARRLSDREAIQSARGFPYQLLAAYRTADPAVPEMVREALQDAMEIAVENVPAVDGKVYVFPDVSGSMRSPVTGSRKGAATAVHCVDVAALVAAAILRKNPGAEVIPFESDVVDLRLNPRDSVFTNAGKLAAVGGGGTNCSAPLAHLNRKNASGDLVVYVSDNQSWVDAGAGRGTATLKEWSRFRARNPAARMVCIDLQPYGTTQAAESADIFNIGGFSDQVFELVARFARGDLFGGHWTELIEKVNL